MSVSANASARRTAKRFFLFSLLEGFAPIYPVYMIMFAGRGYDLTSLSLLLSIWALPVIILELPSGILADRWSKKGIIAIGMLLKALCFVLWGLSPAFWVAALGFVFWGCQSAFCSGARQALIFEALKEKGLEAEYEAMIGLSGAIELASVTFSMIVGGILFASSPSLTLALSSLSSVAASVAACKFHEKRRPGSGSTSAAILSGLRKALSAKSLALLLAAACFASAAYDTIDEFDAFWAVKRYGVPIAWVGAWGALRLSLQGLGGLAVGWIPRVFRRGWMWTTLVAAGALFVASASIPGLWGIPVYLSFYFIMEGASVLFEARLQAAAGDESRASLLSVSSLLMTFVAILLAPLLGLVGDAAGFGWIVIICGGCTIFSGALLAARAPDRAVVGRDL